MNLEKKELCVKVGANIRAIRLKKRVTIEKLAAESNMEYTQLSRIELGQINTSLFQLYKISNALSIKLTELFNQID